MRDLTRLALVVLVFFGCWLVAEGGGPPRLTVVIPNEPIPGAGYNLEGNCRDGEISAAIIDGQNEQPLNPEVAGGGRFIIPISGQPGQRRLVRVTATNGDGSTTIFFEVDFN